MDLGDANEVGAVFLVVVVEVGLVLEVVRVEAAVRQGDVGLHVVGEFNDLERPTLSSEQVFRSIQNLGVRRGRSANLDGGVVAGGLRNVVNDGEHGHDGARIGARDEVGNLLALQRSEQSFGLGRLLVAGANGNDVAVFLSCLGVGALSSECGRRVKARAQSVVAVDHRSVNIGKRAGNARGFRFDELDVIGVFFDVVGGSREARAVVEREQALVLQQQKRASLVGSVGRNGNLMLRGRRPAAGECHGEHARGGGACSDAHNVFQVHSETLSFLRAKRLAPSKRLGASLPYSNSLKEMNAIWVHEPKASM